MDFPIFLFEDHCESYMRWKDAGLKGLAVVHADAHLDLKDEGFSGATLHRLGQCCTFEELIPFRRDDDLLWDGFHIGNYLYPAALDGTVSRLIWVIPPHLPGGMELLPWCQVELQNWKDLTLEEYRSLCYSGNSVTGRLAGVDFQVCFLEDLELHGTSVVWDIDVDYFFDDADLLWLSPLEFTEQLRRKAPNPQMVTIAYSVGGGYTSPGQKYVGDVISSAIRGEAGGMEKGMEALRRGDELLAGGRTEEALSLYGQAEQDAFFRPFVNLRLSSIAREMGDEDREARLLEAVRAEAPSLIVPDYDQALILLRRRKYAQALSLLKVVGERGGDYFLLSRFVSAIACVKMGDFAGAAAQWDSLIESDFFAGAEGGVRSHVLMMAGENCNRMGNFARAITLLTWCVEAAPDNAKAYLLRGAALKDAGEYGRAARDLRRFLSLRPGYVDSLEAHSLLARVYGLQGQAVMEMAELDKLEKKDVTGAYAAKIFIMKRGRERASGRQKS